MKKQIFSGEKMINSGNYIYDYARSFFGVYRINIVSYARIARCSLFNRWI